jgi:hypothetical protein
MKYQVLKNDKSKFSIFNTLNNVEIKCLKNDKFSLSNICNNLNYFADLKDYSNEITILEYIKVIN